MEKLTNELAEALKSWRESAGVREVVEATEKASDSEAGTFEMVITTEHIDRYKEVISLDGWELEHYMKNPVVLWGHSHMTLPIGVTTALERKDGGLVARGKFAPHENAQNIRRLYDLGIVRASSVGFIEKERAGNLITKAELIEWSFVSVPANPHALALAMKAGRSIDELVTKGILTVSEKEEEPAEPPAPVEPPAPEEKTFTNKSLTPIIEQLRAAISGLEALTVEEPEPAEDEPVEDHSEEEKALAKFNEERRNLQQIATMLGDILAEKRQEVEARLKK